MQFQFVCNLHMQRLYRDKTVTQVCYPFTEYGFTIKFTCNNCIAEYRFMETILPSLIQLLGHMYSTQYLHIM